uniref:Kinesin light chain n=1 Tax=Aureoumbra lagunensis TaxID=44058 RepID=A0A7S3NJ15_9STRA|mmetsp:Transcript_6070/g.8577  ORF Transcript_6070/g.8577 Transcript_6070/m.8577 type:complete len:198 (+) Transcript_6070:124-717(+)
MDEVDGEKKIVELRQTLADLEKEKGLEHDDTLFVLHTLAVLIAERGENLEEAGKLFRETLQRSREKYGSRHEETQFVLANYAKYLRLYYGEQKVRTEAQQHTLDLSLKKNGEKHPETLQHMHRLALLLEAEGKLDEAKHWLHLVLNGRRYTLGDDHPHTKASFHDLDHLLQETDRIQYGPPSSWRAFCCRRIVCILQ